MIYRDQHAHEFAHLAQKLYDATTCSDALLAELWK